MKIYSIFDDFGEEPVRILTGAGCQVTVHPKGVERPGSDKMKEIFEEYDGVVIGTSQKMMPDTFSNIKTPKIIGTASVGLDHIQIPEEKRSLVRVVNTPKANAQSVAEYTFASILTCKKRLIEGCMLYEKGVSNKSLLAKPEDIFGAVLGVAGAGAISEKIMEFAHFFGMRILCYTPNPQKHIDLKERFDVEFAELSQLAKSADIISVNLPNCQGTRNIISRAIIELMKGDAIFVSVSRRETVDVMALLEKAEHNPEFYVCLDLDVQDDLAKSYSFSRQILITPHIAGGTVETRKRMFREVAQNIAELVRTAETQN